MRRGVMSGLILLLLCAFPSFASGEEVGSNDLIERAQACDGRAVVYSGEVIGDILNAGTHVWLNVSDGNNAIGVWAQSDLAREIQVAGRYAQRGDTVRVTGAFHRACPEHGGDFDIHAESVALIRRGYPVTREILRWKAVLAIVLSILALACMAFAFFKIDFRLLRKRM